MTPHARRRRRADLAMYAVLVFWAFVVIFPIYWVAITSFKQPIDVNNGPAFLPWIDFQPTLDAWRLILVEQWRDTVRPFTNSVIVALVSASAATFLGTMAGYALNRAQVALSVAPVLALIGGALCAWLGQRFIAEDATTVWACAILGGLAIFAIFRFLVPLRMRNQDLATWIISQRILPPVAVALPIYVMFQSLGMLDSLWSLIILYTAVNLPIAVWLMRDFTAQVPLELEESAIIDGAGRLRIFLRIVLPVVRPGLAATFLFVAVLAWNEYIFGLILSTADTQTMPLLVAAQNATRGPQWWTMSALIIVMIGPVFALALLLERYLRSGALVGAVKG